MPPTCSTLSPPIHPLITEPATPIKATLNRKMRHAPHTPPSVPAAADADAGNAGGNAGDGAKARAEGRGGASVHFCFSQPSPA
ncbi:uncharacterized protein K441DRAFT_660315 [Cenococcum geophilum 1.58]|uniref:uncharacterized protein n=1 Tax=Cenococcum geophilum 1.58 TaxID=794803 RepID=UPI003590100F|nr:hypothetical protein K441DRAFT_660315 [Cenococcum geophilum 1.58]